MEIAVPDPVLCVFINVAQDHEASPIFLKEPSHNCYFLFAEKNQSRLYFWQYGAQMLLESPLTIM